jgi:hypothetical protein
MAAICKYSDVFCWQWKWQLWNEITPRTSAALLAD